MYCIRILCVPYVSFDWNKHLVKPPCCPNYVGPLMKWTGNPILLLCVQVKSLSWAPELGTIFFILVAINIVCVCCMLKVGKWTCTWPGYVHRWWRQTNNERTNYKTLWWHRHHHLVGLRTPQGSFSMYTFINRNNTSVKRAMNPSHGRNCYNHSTVGIIALNLSLACTQIRCELAKQSCNVGVKCS